MRAWVWLLLLVGLGACAQESDDCGTATTCGTCNARPSCGWCAGTRKCLLGGPDKPSGATCSGGWTFGSANCHMCDEAKTCSACIDSKGADGACEWCQATGTCGLVPKPGEKSLCAEPSVGVGFCPGQPAAECNKHSNSCYACATTPGCCYYNLSCHIESATCKKIGFSKESCPDKPKP